MINWEEMSKQDWKEWFEKYPWDRDGEDDEMPSWLEYGVPEGWHEYIRDKVYEPLHELLKPDRVKAFYILQLKEKFGGLRLYYSVNSEKYAISPEEYDKIDEIINVAEEATETLCYRCGEPAQYMTRGWILPVCEKHAKEDLKENEVFEERYRKI